MPAGSKRAFPAVSPFVHLLVPGASLSDSLNLRLTIIRVLTEVDNFWTAQDEARVKHMLYISWFIQPTT